MKKVLFVVPSLCVGGMEKMQVTLANALVHRGYDVSVIALRPDNDLLNLLDNRVSYIYKTDKPHRFWKKIPYIRHILYDDGMWETRATPEQLYEYYIGNEEYDIEIAFFRGLPIKIVAGGKKKNDSRNRTHVVKRIAWVHNDFRKASGYLNNFKTKEKAFDAYKSFDHVVCVSKQAREGYKCIIGDTGNITTIYNMLPVEDIRRLSTESLETKAKKTGLHLVLVGRLLDKAKGQKRLIDVVAKLHDEGKDISLELVGGGIDEDMLKKRISDKQADSYIKMCGSQNNPYPYIKEADLLVCASYFEGYNLTVAEALILGTPVLSTDCTGPNEILDYGKYGMIVENSEEGLYKGLKKLTEAPELLRKYREKALERESFFDEQVIMKQIIDLFERK